MKKLAIGALRHRIAFEKEVKVSDGYKGFTVTWQTVCVVWASVDPLSGREYFYAHQVKAEVTHRVRIRYNEKVTTEMRIRHQNRYLMIESIIDLKERREFQEILAREEK